MGDITIQLFADEYENIYLFYLFIYFYCLIFSLYTQREFFLYLFLKLFCNLIIFFNCWFNLNYFHLNTNRAPKTVENFSVHSRNGYYNGLLFHRVIKGFVIQGGDPNGITILFDFLLFNILFYFVLNIFRYTYLQINKYHDILYALVTISRTYIYNLTKHKKTHNSFPSPSPLSLTPPQILFLLFLINSSTHS